MRDWEMIMLKRQHLFAETPKPCDQLHLISGRKWSLRLWTAPPVIF